MQNYNNPAPPPQPPPGGYAMPPRPPAKKGMSTGVKVLIVVLVLVIGGGALVTVAAGGLVWYLSRKAQETAGVRSTESLKGLATGGGSSSSSSSSSGSSADEAEAPQPTADQQAAVAGGQAAEWEQQEISWTVPQRWKKDSVNSTSFNWSSPGTSDRAFLLVNISPMSADFPMEIANQGTYTEAQTRKQNGEVSEVRWIKLNGVTGVMFREAAPEDSSGSQRLQWIGYRKYKGQTQYVNIMLATEGKYFTQHEDEMYGILYSTKLGE
jgi:hypothetical protein